jgi:hypothetical protein
MKRKPRCPLTPPGTNERCPLEPSKGPGVSSQEPPVVVVRTERRSWITIAITGFGALLVRYLKTVRQRRQTGKKKQ